MLSSVRWPDVRQLIYLLPLDRLAVLVGCLFLSSIVGVRFFSVIFGIAAFAAAALVVIWAWRRGSTWLKLAVLVGNGTPGSLLSISAKVLETWPTLVESCGWMPRDALGLRVPYVVRAAERATGNGSPSGPRIIRLEPHPAGWGATVRLTPTCGTTQIEKAKETIADVWGADRVEVSRARPGEAMIVAHIRDPLAGVQRAFTDVPDAAAQVTADDFLGKGGGSNGHR
ncbi:hypothetical protein [Microbacterium amylolyticum]|uniref:DUF3239 domain-containing protein n=1 Tax=Microbacterium amylolyticum TaxID=936337 RepID=A0ABS4ZIY8_9MICO|nr:hypothetical protein [Microbacterium amylolyticum]MBP2437246.1 hypothetical protein [Microbacterium amylolyticum]